MSNYERHKCPFPAAEHRDTTVLQDIIYEDGRSIVKLDCIQVLAKEIVKPRTHKIDADRLEQVFNYMKVYPWFIELQILGMKLFASVLDTDRGVVELDTICVGWEAHVRLYENVDSAKKVIGELCAKYEERTRNLIGALGKCPEGM